MLKHLTRAALAAAAILPTAAPAHAAERVTSTAYCLRGTMADGTWTRPASVAMNSKRLGTKVRVSRSPTGRKRFVVRDRIGWGTQLDFWVPTCGQAFAWGRRTVRVAVIPR